MTVIYNSVWDLNVNNVFNLLPKNEVVLNSIVFFFMLKDDTQGKTKSIAASLNKNRWNSVWSSGPGPILRSKDFIFFFVSSTLLNIILIEVVFGSRHTVWIILERHFKQIILIDCIYNYSLVSVGGRKLSDKKIGLPATTSALATQRHWCWQKYCIAFALKIILKRKWLPGNIKFDISFVTFITNIKQITTTTTLLRKKNLKKQKQQKKLNTFLNSLFSLGLLY